MISLVSCQLCNVVSIPIDSRCCQIEQRGFTKEQTLRGSTTEIGTQSAWRDCGERFVFITESAQCVDLAEQLRG